MIVWRKKTTVWVPDTESMFLQRWNYKVDNYANTNGIYRFSTLITQFMASNYQKNITNHFYFNWRVKCYRCRIERLIGHMAREIIVISITKKSSKIQRFNKLYFRFVQYKRAFLYFCWLLDDFKRFCDPLGNFCDTNCESPKLIWKFLKRIHWKHT